MDIMETTLGDEISKISSSGLNSLPYLKVVVHSPAGEFEVMGVVNFDVMRDYLVQYCDEITAVLLIPKGQLAFRMIPYTDRLEATVFKGVSAMHGAPQSNAPLLVNRYKMILSSPADPAADAAMRALPDEFTMDLEGFEQVSVQFFEPVMEQFAMQTCGGIYRKTPIADIVRSILLHGSAMPQVDDDYKTVGIDMVEPDDSGVREHVVLPPWTPCTDALGYLQKHAGGIYPAGLSYFYQNDSWYVFPPFDFSRYNSASRQLIIYRVPEQRMPHIERTWMQEGSVTSVIATGEFSLRNYTQNKKISEGNGLMYADASKLFEDGVQVAGNKALASRGRSNNEFVSSAQASGLNKLVQARERITANKHQQASVLAAREGAEIQMVWQNANPDLLTPGIQTRIYFMRAGKICEVQAVLIGVQSSTALNGQGMLTGSKQCNAALRFWVDPTEV